MIEKPLYRYGSLDSGSVCKLFRAEDIYFPSADDHTNPQHIQRFIDAALANEHVYVLGRNPRAEAFIFAPGHNGSTFHAHFAVRKDYRDGSLVRRVAEAGKWVFENTTCRSVLAHLRDGNEGAGSVLAQLGMKRIGRLKKSVKFNGEYLDETVWYGTVDDFNALWGAEFGEVS